VGRNGIPHSEGACLMAVREMIEIESITSPGKLFRVEAAKYHAMRDALLGVLPDAPPGLTFKEMKQALIPFLPDDLFPGGEKAGWWLAGVQLDLEAKRIITRIPTKPLRFHKL